MPPLSIYPPTHPPIRPSIYPDLVGTRPSTGPLKVRGEFLTPN